MAQQARAAATRQTIIDAAVDLFTERGYGETSLADVLKRADVTKGAFYYHFDSQEALAAAIMDEGLTRVAIAFGLADESADPTLDTVIRGSFQVAHLITNDKTVAVGKQLAQSLTQVSSRGPTAFVEWTDIFARTFNRALENSGLSSELDPGDLSETVWLSVLGCMLLTDAIGDDLVARQARAWSVLLPAIVPDCALPRYRNLVDRTQLSMSRPPTAQ